jgi:hypothetical protein
MVTGCGERGQRKTQQLVGKGGNQLKVVYGDTEQGLPLVRSEFFFFFFTKATTL